MVSKESRTYFHKTKEPRLTIYFVTGCVKGLDSGIMPVEVFRI